MKILLTDLIKGVRINYGGALMFNINKIIRSQCKCTALVLMEKSKKLLGDNYYNNYSNNIGRGKCIHPISFLNDDYNNWYTVMMNDNE